MPKYYYHCNNCPGDFFVYHLMSEVQEDCILCSLPGVSKLLTKPLFFGIDYFFKILGNYGLAIIAITLCIRIVFFPLNQYSMKSMGKMKSLGPEIENLKTRFKDDKQQLQKEMMKLYKVNGVNPASSCFPILIQIPIFFSLYNLKIIRYKIH